MPHKNGVTNLRLDLEQEWEQKKHKKKSISLKVNRSNKWYESEPHGYNVWDYWKQQKVEDMQYASNIGKKPKFRIKKIGLLIRVYKEWHPLPYKSFS